MPHHRHYVGYAYNPATGVNRDQFGAAPAAPRPAPRPASVSGQAVGLVNIAFKPVRWAFEETGNLAKWVGGTLQKIGSKL